MLCICAEHLLSLNCYFIALVCLGGCGILVVCYLWVTWFRCLLFCWLYFGCWLLLWLWFMVGLFAIVAWLGVCGLLGYGGVLLECFCAGLFRWSGLHGWLGCGFGVGLGVCGFGWCWAYLVGCIWLGFWGLVALVLVVLRLCGGVGWRFCLWVYCVVCCVWFLMFVLC